MRTIDQIIDHNDAVLSVGQTSVLLTAEEWHTLKSKLLSQPAYNQLKAEFAAALSVATYNNDLGIFIFRPSEYERLRQLSAVWQHVVHKF